MSNDSLIGRMLKTGASTGASIMSESDFLHNSDVVSTPVPILNLAFSGNVDGGFGTGFTIVSGESKTFKSLTSLYCLKAYLDKYEDAIGILYDSEYGLTLDAMNAFGVDSSRIIHVPVEHVEQLKFDFVKKLDEIKKGDKVFFLIDSLGQLSSKKEVDDAVDEKVVADLQRTRSIRSLFRLTTHQLVKKDLPCFVINHVYTEMSGGPYAKTVIPGGQSVTLSANAVLVITKSQEKDSKTNELSGWNFNINIHKSRLVKEKAKFTMRVLYEDGIKKYSGILPLALESGMVIKPSNGWYQLVDVDTGELMGNKVREKDTETEEFLGSVVKQHKFKEWCKNKFRLGSFQIDVANRIQTEDEVDSEEE